MRRGVRVTRLFWLLIRTNCEPHLAGHRNMMIYEKLSAMRWRGSGQIHNASVKQGVVPV